MKEKEKNGAENINIKRYYKNRQSIETAKIHGDKDEKYFKWFCLVCGPDRVQYTVA